MKSHKRSMLVVIADKLLNFFREVSSYIEILQEDNAFPNYDDTKNN